VVAETSGGEHVYASFYAYLFGDRAAEVAARDEPAWRAWMARHFPMVESAPAGEAPAGGEPVQRQPRSSTAGSNP